MLSDLVTARTDAEPAVASTARWGVGAVKGDDDMKDSSSPVCSAKDADDAYMGYASREEIVEFLNVLLEAERAGARVTLSTTIEAAEPELRALAKSIHQDEAHWCGVLFGAVRRLGGVPSLRTGAFHDKAMAIVDLRMRLAFLNRGQEWVVHKLREMLPKVKDEELYGKLNEMLTAHERNIERVAGSGLVKPP